MKRDLFKKTCLAACLSLMMGAASADVSYSFGSLLSGDSVPAWAGIGTVAITGENTSVWTFTLTIDDLTADVFGDGTFAGGLSVSFLENIGKKDATIVAGDDVVSLKNGGGPGGSWDLSFSFPSKNSDRLFAGDSVTWTVDFGQNTPTLSSDPFALHIQAIDINGGGSAWYATAVPEPSTYAMMGLSLLGIGLVCARRRRLPV